MNSRAISASIAVLIVVALIIVGTFGAILAAHYAYPQTIATSTGLTTSFIHQSVSLSSSVSTSTRLGSCEVSYTPSINGTFPTVVLVATNSTSNLCVTIINHNYSNDNITALWNTSPDITMLKNGSWIQPQNLTVDIRPNIDVSPESNESVVFTITPSSGTHAVFDIGLPTPCWMDYEYFFVIAIGLNSSEIQNMHSAILSVAKGTYYGCSGTLYAYPTITGYSNLIPVSVNTVT
jgi:hypothetical protein